VQSEELKFIDSTNKSAVELREHKIWSKNKTLKYYISVLAEDTLLKYSSRSGFRKKFRNMLYVAKKNEINSSN
jgi:hypothetical protein